ncbi:hypothetical protein Fuma_05511 [Fuerstiella marisgermanici]|uniref:Uncharacterized protein n=1 Tax=Fuerstiella marisgermanici TaxID=1891926 RepID=A0A1P8WP76_9PLAN|nr:hypothetical protein Fuma_05511 [Fuerstiella marisgermanici]
MQTIMSPKGFEMLRFVRLQTTVFRASRTGIACSHAHFVASAAWEPCTPLSPGPPAPLMWIEADKRIVPMQFGSVHGVHISEESYSS